MRTEFIIFGKENTLKKCTSNGYKNMVIAFSISPGIYGPWIPSSTLPVWVPQSRSSGINRVRFSVM